MTPTLPQGDRSKAAKPLAVGSVFDGLTALSGPDVHLLLQGRGPEERYWFREDLGEHGILDSALLTRESDVLVVTFHGLLDRRKFKIPRFERARMTEPFGTSCLYWADPSLWLDRDLKLAWFTGSGSLDLFEIIAERTTSVAKAIGAKRIIFTGSSGGGFAALQASALVPGSTALVFNPQTAIYAYRTPMQKAYLRICQPEVCDRLGRNYNFSFDWTESLGDRFSSLRRYQEPRQNHVIYWTNRLDWHHEDHYKPFAELLAARSGDDSAFISREYEQEGGHRPPSAEQYFSAMSEALASSAGVTNE